MTRSPFSLALVGLLALVPFTLAPAVRAQDAAKDSGTNQQVTEDDVIAGMMNIEFKTRTNLDTSGDLKKGSAAIGAQDKYSFQLNVAKTTEFAGDILRQPKLFSSVLGRTKHRRT